MSVNLVTQANHTDVTEQILNEVHIGMQQLPLHHIVTQINLQVSIIVHSDYLLLDNDQCHLNCKREIEIEISEIIK